MVGFSRGLGGAHAPPIPRRVVGKSCVSMATSQSVRDESLLALLSAGSQLPSASGCLGCAPALFVPGPNALPTCSDLHLGGG